MSQAEEARKIFVENYKKFKKYFGESFIRIIQKSINVGKIDGDDGINSILFYLQKSDSPAQLWDGVDEQERGCLWNALINSAKEKSNDLEIESNSYLGFCTIWDKIDPIDEEDEDEMEDEDSSDVPNILYHATPKENVDNILDNGIIPGLNGKVTLCEDPKNAAKLAARHVGGDTSKVTIFEIDTITMENDGHFLEKNDHGRGVIWEISDTISPTFFKKI